MPDLTRLVRTALVLLLGATAGVPLRAELIPAQHKEGSLRGFLLLFDENGRSIATGDLSQSLHGKQVVSRLTFHFRDGSLDDERTVFTQDGSFHLVRDHHIQKGHSFPQPIDVDIDVAGQQVTTRTGDNGEPEVKIAHMDLPEDLANGLPIILAKNIKVSTAETRVAYLGTMPKPRLVHLKITPDGEDTFSIGANHYKAAVFRFHVEIGGVTGMIAPMIGKEPVDDRAWVSEGTEPAFLRAQVSFYNNGPLWTIQLASPVWPRK